MSRKKTRHSVPGLAERLVKVREALGPGGRQDLFASSIGISLRSWQDYEHGKAAPGPHVLVPLVERGVSMRWLLTGKGPMFDSSSEPGRVGEPEFSYGEISEDERKLLDLYRSLTEEGKELALDLLESVAKREHKDSGYIGAGGGAGRLG